jgi:phytanoyl-CoA dioxygenase PhyH
MRSLLATLTRSGRGPSHEAAEDPGLERDSAALREEIMEHGLDADRALALGDALERDGQLLAALDALVEANRMRRHPALERRIVRLRLRAFGQLDRSLTPAWPPVVPEDEPGTPEGPPVVQADDLNVALLRNGILRHGSVWVRGLVPKSRVARLRHAMDKVFEAHDAVETGQASPETATWYDPLDNIQNPQDARNWRRQANAVLAADSPRGFFELMETVNQVRLDALIGSYFGERPALAAEKVTMFRVHAQDWRLRLANWHQDGAFLGKGIRTVNVWFALSRCGRDAPGMALYPIALDRILPVGEPGSIYDWSLSPDTIARELPGVPIWQPECDEGDALIFDHLTLHKTHAVEGMANWRYAFETWFFAPSVYPEGVSTPLVV